jgi:hypothetical protein
VSCAAEGSTLFTSAVEAAKADAGHPQGARAGFFHKIRGRMGAPGRDARCSLTKNRPSGAPGKMSLARSLRSSTLRPIAARGTLSVPDRLTTHQFRVLVTLALYTRLKQQAEGCHYQLMKFEEEQRSEQGHLPRGEQVSAVYDRGGACEGQWVQTLKRLVEYRMLTARRDANGGRKRVQYSITEIGRIAAREWIDEAEDLLRKGKVAFPKEPEAAPGDQVLLELKK